MARMRNRSAWQKSGLMVVLAGIGMLVAACGGTRSDVFAPVGTSVAGASRVDILVATTRASSDIQGDLFSGERGKQLSLVDVAISIPPEANRQVGEVQWPRSVPGNAETEFVVLGTTPPWPRASLRAWLQQPLCRRRVQVCADCP
jgi:esterase/lipase superfamily enzyme